MLDVFLDALIDSLKTLPFLFAAYFLIEYLEHRASSKMERGLQKLGKFGPIGGALLGVLLFQAGDFRLGRGAQGGQFGFGAQPRFDLHADVRFGLQAGLLGGLVYSVIHLSISSLAAPPHREGRCHG